MAEIPRDLARGVLAKKLAPGRIPGVISGSLLGFLLFSWLGSVVTGSGPYVDFIGGAAALGAVILVLRMKSLGSSFLWSSAKKLGAPVTILRSIEEEMVSGMPSISAAAMNCS